MHFDYHLMALSNGMQYGLIGSTEWGEDFADFVDQYVVAYLNLGMSALDVQ